MKVRETSDVFCLSHLVTTNVSFTTILASLRYAAIQLCMSCAVVILPLGRFVCVCYALWLSKLFSGHIHLKK